MAEGADGGGPSTLDFMLGRQDMSPACRDQSRESSADATLRKLRSVINDNLLCLGMTGALVLVSFLVLLYVVTSVIDLLRSWRLGLANSRLSLERGEKAVRPDSVNDDVRYKTKPGRRTSSLSAAAAARQRTAGAPEATLVRGALGKLAARYGDYNAAIVRYGANRRDSEAAADVIDARVLSRGDDDYSYGDATVAKGAMVVRKGEGLEVVRGDADVRAEARARMQPGGGEGGEGGGAHHGRDDAPEHPASKFEVAARSGQ